MTYFSSQVNKFLQNVGIDKEYEIEIVPKSDSCASPGEFVLFRYKLGQGKGSRAFRIALVVQPVTRDAKTGNLLLTVFRLPDSGTYTPDSLVTLYKNKEIPKDKYRTYIMRNIYGPLRRIRRNPSLKSKQ
jgi:hypothetical protein